MSSTPRSINLGPLILAKLQAIQVGRYVNSSNFTKNIHSVLVDERNRLCRDILDKADGKFSTDEKSVSKSTEKSHEWKQKGYLYEKHLMEVEATLDWLIKMKMELQQRQTNLCL